MYALALVVDQCSRAAQSHELTCACADVYLGAPCAVPLDPRQRLVVPKYNPARTFTPEVRLSCLADGTLEAGTLMHGSHGAPAYLPTPKFN